MKIVQMRKLKGITQEELARLCETTQQQIAKIEKGLVDPKLTTLRKVAEALSCDLTDLFYTRQEFVSEINAVIEAHKVNLKKVSLIALNSLCALERKLPAFHPYWEKIQIKNNRVSISGGSNEKRG